MCSDIVELVAVSIFSGIYTHTQISKDRRTPKSNKEPEVVGHRIPALRKQKEARLLSLRSTWVTQ
jgi:hypothetical protein